MLREVNEAKNMGLCKCHYEYWDRMRTVQRNRFLEIQQADFLEKGSYRDGYGHNTVSHCIHLTDANETKTIPEIQVLIINSGPELMICASRAKRKEKLRI
jgi:hypothetical protein